MFCCDYNAIPKIITGFFSDSNSYNNPTHFLRITHEYNPSFAKSTFKLFSIQCYGPRLYSTIPLSIKDQSLFCPFNILYLLFKKLISCTYCAIFFEYFLFSIFSIYFPFTFVHTPTCNVLMRVCLIAEACVSLRLALELFYLFFFLLVYCCAWLIIKIAQKTKQ